MGNKQTLNKNSMAFASFFAGIGGFDVALCSEGFEPVAHCEIDQFCQGVLAKHWPKTALFSDITSLDPDAIPAADLWCGGFPCQDVSVARGSKGRAGLAGENSGLFYSFLDLIRARLPDTLLLENVVGLLNSHGGQDFHVILTELTNLGYTVAWRVMNSRYFGAPQSRPRVFVCASRVADHLPIKVLFEDSAGSKPGGARQGFLREDRCDVSGAIVAEIAYCLAATSGRHTGTDWSRTYVSYKDAVRRLTPSECEGIQGFPLGWTANIGNPGVAVADEDSLRYKALGNAVSVPVANWIAKRLKSEIFSATKTQRQRPLGRPFDYTPDFEHKSLRKASLADLVQVKKGIAQIKWQSGGYAKGDDCWDVSAPQAPTRIISTRLISVLERSVNDARYFLSANAAEGILRRVASQNRTLFPPMDQALRQMVLEGARNGACLPNATRRTAA